MAPDAQEFPGRRDSSHVLRPEWGRRAAPQGEGGDPGERAGDHTTLPEASQPPPPALTHLLHLVMVELREEVSEQMRGDHFATARRRRDGKPRLERLWGRRAARSDSFGGTGSGESERPAKKANSDGPPAEGSPVSRIRFGEPQLLEGSQKNHSRRRVGLSRCQGANFSHRTPRAQLGKTLNQVPRGVIGPLPLTRALLSPAGLLGLVTRRC